MPGERSFCGMAAGTRTKSLGGGAIGPPGRTPPAPPPAYPSVCTGVAEDGAGTVITAPHDGHCTRCPASLASASRSSPHLHVKVIAISQFLPKRSELYPHHPPRAQFARRSRSVGIGPHSAAGLYSCAAFPCAAPECDTP